MSLLANFDAMPSAKLACPNCQHTIVYYDVAGSDHYACEQCHSYFRYSGEEQPVVLNRYNGGPPADLKLLPVGTPGSLNGQACRVVGYTRRCEVQHPEYEWTEYEVFQPATQEYVQLSLFNGHWMLIRPANQMYEVTSDNGGYNHVKQPDATYKLYNRYQARVIFAEGEFNWNIEEDENLTLSEFIAPPVMLVQAQRGAQATWHRAEHIEPKTVAATFGLNVSDLPARDRMGAVQPNSFKTAWPALRAVTLLAVALLCFGQFYMFSTYPEKQLLNQTLTVRADSSGTPGTNKVLVSSSFTLDHQAALEIDLRTTLNNQWLELPVSLVNEQTGQGFEFTKNIEFYGGVEGGESWTEGDREADAVLARVPPGRYHLNFYPFTEKGVAPTIDVLVTTIPAVWSNFFIVLGLVLVFPAVWAFHSMTMERERWFQSDYNPYPVAV